MGPRFVAKVALCALACVGCAAQADWYVGVGAGQGSIDERGSFGVSGLSFGGPTVDHDLCGGTATITVGAEPLVDHIDASAGDQRLFVGWRSGAFGVELGQFNVARMQGSATAGPDAVAQPTCNPAPTDPITVDAQGVKLEDVAVHGVSLTPFYSLPFAERWSLDLRATLSAWDREERSQWQILVTEMQGGQPLQTYPATWVNGSASARGVDLGFGVGVSWRLRPDLRLRALIDQQRYDTITVRGVGLALVIDL